MKAAAWTCAALLALPLALRATEPPPGFAPGQVAPPPSIHQREAEAHALLPPPPEPAYPLVYTVAPAAREEGLPSPEALTRTVYGFMPYWEVSSLTHIQWDLITHVCYFSVEMNPDGTLGNLHNWPDGASVTALRNTAHANGAKVILAVTLFNTSEDPTRVAAFLGNSSYWEPAIDDLVFQVQDGTADGVNIDFETVSHSQKTNFVSFITALTSRFHSDIPGSHVSIDTPAVDWSGAYDYDQLAINCDGMFIMGYDYYYGGSTTAGPCSPLTGGGVWGTYNVTWTVNDYMTYGLPANRSKFILGLPYYGHEWPTASTSIPSSATPPADTIFYNDARTNEPLYGRIWDGASQTPYYVYTSGGAHQGWYDDAQSLGLKWDLVNTQDIGGTGMWAMNYDTHDDLLWDTLRAKFATTAGDLAGVKIGIDPGHGGTDSGAVGPTGLAEKEVNLATSLLLRDALQDQGATCYLTRTGDSTVSLTARTDYFNSIPVDRSESCHYNACGNCGANYTGVHVYMNTLGQCVASATSKDMAAKTVLRLDAALGIGVRPP